MDILLKISFLLAIIAISLVSSARLGHLPSSIQYTNLEKYFY